VSDGIKKKRDIFVSVLSHRKKIAFTHTYVRIIINNDNDNDMDDSENHVIGRLFCSTSRATVAA
jgi:hypothetical protein